METNEPHHDKVVFPTDAVTVTGLLSDFCRFADSGPHLTIARAGTHDAPNRVRPSAPIWTTSVPA